MLNTLRSSVIGALVVLASFTSAIGGEEQIRLWQDAFYGMPLQQVLAKFPDAKRDPEGSPMADGALELAHIAGYSVVGHKFRVRFFFLEKKLSQVMLSLERDASVDRYGADGIYGALKEVLDAKYGRPLTVEEDPATPYRKSITWFQGNMNVTILYWAPATLNVAYQVRIAAEAGKL